MGDWRLRGQESYLKGAKLKAEHFLPMKDGDLQTHCSFCWGKMCELKEGYCTINGKRWVCQKCFEDFRESFEWKVD